MAISFPIILADAITTVTVGPSVGIRGERVSIGNAKDRQRYDLPIEVTVNASGAAASTATVQPQVSADGTTWVSWGSALSFVIPANGQSYSKFPIGRLSSSHDYIRLNVTAISGATIYGYVVRKG